MSRGESGALVIGGDQVLGFEGKAYGKVSSPEAAAETLAGFAGRTHTLHSTFTFAFEGRVLGTVQVDVPMAVRPLNAREIPLVELCAALRRQGVDGLMNPAGPWG